MQENHDCDRNLKTILAVGDCNTSGMSDSAHENMPEVLKRIFQSHGQDTALINLGHAMYTTREGVARVEACGEALNGIDVLLVNFGLVDSWRAVLPTWYISYFPDNTFKRLGRKLLKSLKKRLRKPWIRKLLPVSHTIPLDEYAENYMRIIQTVRTKSPNVRVVLWATVPTYLSEERDVEIKLFNKRLQDMAAQNGFDYIDTRTLFMPYSFEELYKDHVHLNNFGQQLVAQAIFDRCQIGRADQRTA